MAEADASIHEQMEKSKQTIINSLRFVKDKIQKEEAGRTGIMLFSSVHEACLKLDEGAGRKLPGLTNKNLGLKNPHAHDSFDTLANILREAPSGIIGDSDPRMQVFITFEDIFSQFDPDGVKERIRTAEGRELIQLVTRLYKTYDFLADRVSEMIPQLAPPHLWDGYRKGRHQKNWEAESGGSKRQSNKDTYKHHAQLIFTELVYKETREKLEGTALEVLQKDRRGEPVGYGPLSQCVNMIQTLSEATSSEFLPKFLDSLTADVEDFYKAQVEAWRDIAASDYMRQAMAAVEAETARGKRFQIKEDTKNNEDAESNLPSGRATEEVTHTDLGRRLGDAASAVLFRDYKRILYQENAGLDYLLRQEHRTADIRMMFECLCRNAAAVEEMRETYSSFIDSRGNELLGDPQSKAGKSIGVIEVIEKAITFRRHVHKLASEVFREQVDFSSTYQNHMKKVLQLIPDGPMNLALYLDHVMRNVVEKAPESGHKSAQSLMEEVFKLYVLLRDRDVFEKWAKKHFAKRLLARPKSLRFEQMMLEVYKNTQIFDNRSSFLSDISDMYKDSQASSNPSSIRKYESDLEAAGFTKKGQPKIAPMVIKTSLWPVDSRSGQKYLPLEVRAVSDAYALAYARRNSGRKLDYLLMEGTAQIKYRNNGKTYIIIVTTPQMIILSRFNQKSSWTVRELSKSVGLSNSPREFEGHLFRLLCKVRGEKNRNLLKKRSSSGGQSAAIDLDDVISINERFSSKKLRFALAAHTIKDSAAHKMQIEKSVAVDRSHLVDAIIVRVMKASRKLTHANLIAEVIEQLAGRFVVQISLIKTRIESLIEKEYMRRDPDDNSTYHYVA